MSDKEKKEKKVKEKKEKEFIGILIGNFMECTSHGPHVTMKNMKAWKKGQILFDMNKINVLLGLGAPIEIYYKHVHGTAES